MTEKENGETAIGRLVVKCLLGIGLFTCLLMYGCPQYSVYTARKEGEAVLAHAMSSKEVAVSEARAKYESAALLAQADTIRAHGIARSNQIIGQSITKNYLNWFFIDNLEKNPNAVIYIPTEANMPILEAGARSRHPVQEFKVPDDSVPIPVR